MNYSYRKDAEELITQHSDDIISCIKKNIAECEKNHNAFAATVNTIGNLNILTENEGGIFYKAMMLQDAAILERKIKLMYSYIIVKNKIYEDIFHSYNINKTLEKICECLELKSDETSRLCRYITSYFAIRNTFAHNDCNQIIHYTKPKKSKSKKDHPYDDSQCTVNISKPYNLDEKEDLAVCFNKAKIGVQNISSRYRDAASLRISVGAWDDSQKGVVELCMLPTLDDVAEVLRDTITSIVEKFEEMLKILETRFKKANSIAALKTLRNSDFHYTYCYNGIVVPHFVCACYRVSAFDDYAHKSFIQDDILNSDFMHSVTKLEVRLNILLSLGIGPASFFGSESQYIEGGNEAAFGLREIQNRLFVS